MKVVFQNVTKNYGLIPALKNVSFEVDSGEFVFVTGPSGSGKSTLIKLILQQIKPTSGEIIIGEINLNSSTKKEAESIRQQTGVIFQDFQLINDKTIEENIALALDIIDLPKNEQLARIDEVIESVNLSSRRFLFPSQLSGGELQRAALARALSVRPKLILADEPTGNLDAENSWNLLKLLKQINTDSGTTIIMTTHNLDIINSFKKRVINLRYGELEQEEKPQPKTHKKHVNR